MEGEGEPSTDVTLPTHGYLDSKLAMVMAAMRLTVHSRLNDRSSDDSNSQTL